MTRDPGDDPMDEVLDEEGEVVRCECGEPLRLDGGRTAYCPECEHELAEEARMAGGES